MATSWNRPRAARESSALMSRAKGIDAARVAPSARAWGAKTRGYMALRAASQSLELIVSAMDGRCVGITRALLWMASQAHTVKTAANRQNVRSYQWRAPTYLVSERKPASFEVPSSPTWPRSRRRSHRLEPEDPSLGQSDSGARFVTIPTRDSRLTVSERPRGCLARSPGSRSQPTLGELEIQLQQCLQQPAGLVDILACGARAVCSRRPPQAPGPSASGDPTHFCGSQGGTVFVEPCHQTPV